MPRKNSLVACRLVSSSRLILIGIASLFLLVRLPLMYRQPGGQDEGCYAIPGLTILRTGIPRLPHVPARNPESVYYRADEALFAEPPLSFYIQALLYAVFPHQFGTARLASALAGMILLELVYRITLEAGGNERAALWAAGLFSVSRWFYFPATAARPDIWCAVFGGAALLCGFKFQQNLGEKWLVWAGVCLGLGGLSHPFALIYAVQLAVWFTVISSGWQQVLRPLVLAVVALLTASLWLPLMIMFPQACLRQFQNQFGHSSGGPLWFRLLMPWESLWYHGNVMWDHIGVWQFLLAGVGLVVLSLVCWRHPAKNLTALIGLAWSSLYLMSGAVGRHHPVIGYWVYPAALMFVAVGWSIDALIRAAERTGVGGWLRLPLTLVLMASMLPGLGLRALATHLRHWNDVDYNAPLFAQRLMDSLPADWICAVDTQFTLDFVAAGRPTLWAQTMPIYFRLDQCEYDVLIISREGDDFGLARQLGGQLLRTEGVREDIFACYAEIYLPSSSSSP